MTSYDHCSENYRYGDQEVNRAITSQTPILIKFWLVWNDDGYPPRFRHETEADAIREAQRLASESRGKQFYILEATAIVEQAPAPTRITTLISPAGAAVTRGAQS